jgi:hypothetical protein
MGGPLCNKVKSFWFIAFLASDMPLQAGWDWKNIWRAFLSASINVMVFLTDDLHEKQNLKIDLG